MTILALATAAAMAYTATIDTTSNQSILLKTNSDDFASQACMIAASKGLKAVRTFSLESNINYYAVKNKLKCNRTMSEVFNAKIQLIKRINPPVIDTFFEPTLSTNRPSTGEKTNIPRVW